jgi:hypothetical protein
LEGIALLLAVIFIAAGSAFALPKTQAKQVTVDPSEMAHSTNTTAQLVLKDLDDAIPGQATTTTAGTVRFSTDSEANAGTSTVTVISPQQLKTYSAPNWVLITNHTSISITNGISGGTTNKAYLIAGFQTSGGYTASRVRQVSVRITGRLKWNNSGDGVSLSYVSLGRTNQVFNSAMYGSNGEHDSAQTVLVSLPVAAAQTNLNLISTVTGGQAGTFIGYEFLELLSF